MTRVVSSALVVDRAEQSAVKSVYLLDIPNAHTVSTKSPRHLSGERFPDYATRESPILSASEGFFVKRFDAMPYARIAPKSGLNNGLKGVSALIRLARRLIRF
jgi:hypothetical protein